MVYYILCYYVWRIFVMGKGIYTYYKERLIELGGKNKCLYLKNIVKKSAYDIGKLFEGRERKVAELSEFLQSGKGSLTLISRNEADEIADNIGLPEKTKKEPDTTLLNDKDAKAALRSYKKKLDSDIDKIIDGEVAKIRELRREVEDIEKETGRYELYIGYPFVFGSINQGISKTLIKAPLFLFPVKIDIHEDDTVELRFNEAEPIQLNRALIFAYAQTKKLDVEQLELEFEDLYAFKNVKAAVEYLRRFKIRIDCTNSKSIYSYSKFKEPEAKGDLSIRYAAVLARLPLSNSIYSDYNLLEKKKLTNDAINELLRTGKRIMPKKAKKTKPLKAKGKHVHKNNNYTVKMLDYSQSEVVKKVDEMGNMVIYGPPGTGKSQTIVNIITDAVCKNKRVLVVSQKKAALDVVYSRLGVLSEKAMYISDEPKEKKKFYEKCLAAHQKDEVESLVDVDAIQKEYDILQDKIDADIAILEEINGLLNDKREFGLSLQEMYSSSYIPAKSSSEYSIYQKLIENSDIMSLDYRELGDALFTIQAKNLSDIYYSYLQQKERNPLIDHMLPDCDLRTLAEVRDLFETAQKTRKGFFNLQQYSYPRQVLAQYSRLPSEEVINSIADTELKLSHKGLLSKGKKRQEIKDKVLETYLAINDYVQEYECLNFIMDKDGFVSVVDNLLRGNHPYVKLVYDALDNYTSMRDVGKLVSSIDNNIAAILSFAYTNSKNLQGYKDIIGSILNLRIYHELIKYEEQCKEQLSKLLDVQNISSRIYKNKEAELSVAYKLCAGKNSTEYRELYDKAENAKDYLYQISKDKNLWPIRKTMETYGDFITKLFPCWLLSPENVSAILPLQKNMFDLVIFDEASQVFIESTIPTIYRGKNIVVAGDGKQLRPSATFMKRYLGADPETKDDLSVQAALEVDSLLDLAVSRYDSANLNYHYRSRYEELISFSNSAFYSSSLNVAPNTSGNRKDPPIVRYKVDGRWTDRTNPAEAQKIVEILKDIFRTRKRSESIGIITFNSDQQSLIADTIDKAARADEEFRGYIATERYRTDNGEDASLFIKNLENVQGDERDIIIFSIGYAKNETGRVYANFGSLSADGGENRLNVAITRAKSKIIVVTSIEPEELRVDGTKNNGPKLLKEYLVYARAVSEGDTASARAILSSLDKSEHTDPVINASFTDIKIQIKERLEKLGYEVVLDLGNRDNRISLAVYDAKTDRYLIGVQLDKDVFASTSSALEREVYKPRFLESRGWTIMRVWCRDFWLSPAKVVKSIASAAEKNR